MASLPGGYPAARRLDLIEDLHGYPVADPYRWLEDPESAETRQWLTDEEETWAGYRDGLPGREAFTARARELLRVGSVGLPAWRGPLQFYTRRDPDQEHAVLYVAGGAGGQGGEGAATPGAPAEGAQPGDGPERVLIDPVAVDPAGRTTLDAWSPDKEGRL